MCRSRGIEVILFRDTDECIVGFEAKGHANTAPHGQDIVCAAVSVLTQTAALGLSEHLKRDLVVSQKSGALTVMLKGEADLLTSVIFETMRLGLQEIEKINPQIVHIRCAGGEM